MTMQTSLAQLLNAGKFDEARRLLEEQLASGVLLDPRTDKVWARIADGIAGEIERSSDRHAFVGFWEALLDFFVNSIEPAWGHTHKGHIYFRLGFAHARADFEGARRNFELAYAEDLLQARTRGGTQEEIKRRSYEYSAYVALCILERIDDSDFDTAADRHTFVDSLFGPSFDAAILEAQVDASAVQSALTVIVPAKGLRMVEERFDELRGAASLNLPFSTVSLMGTLLEAILLAVLYHGKGVKTLSNGKDILLAQLGPLLCEAMLQSVFPTTGVQAACRLIHIFRNRLHPGNELRQTYPLVPRVARTLRILFERALLEWGAARSPTPPQPGR